MAFISVNCSCGKSFKVESAKAGKRIRCACGAVLLVPDPSSAPAPEALAVNESTVAPKKAARLPRRAEINAKNFDADNKSNLLKFIAIIVGVGVLCVGLAVAFVKTKPPSVVYKGQDAEATEFIRNATEAREWVQGRDVMLGGMSQKQAAYKIDQWYDMGAKKVYTQGKLALFVVIELPADPLKRKSIFDWYYKFIEKSNESPVVDEGQNFLMFKAPLGGVN